jgi:hypothetical protein
VKMTTATTEKMEMKPISTSTGRRYKQ